MISRNGTKCEIRLSEPPARPPEKARPAFAAARKDIMSGPNDETKQEDEIRLEELLPLLEFGCWTAIVLFPFLYFVNGPAVSTDQLVVRTILVITAVTGAVVLRIWNWRARRRRQCG